MAIIDFRTTDTSGNTKNALLASQAQQQALQNLSSTFGDIGGQLRESGLNQAVNPLINAQDGSNQDVINRIRQLGADRNINVDKHIKRQEDIQKGSLNLSLEQQKFSLDADNNVANEKSFLTSQSQSISTQEEQAAINNGSYIPRLGEVGTDQPSITPEQLDNYSSNDLFGNDAIKVRDAFETKFKRPPTVDEFNYIASTGMTENNVPLQSEYDLSNATGLVDAFAEIQKNNTAKRAELATGRNAREAQLQTQFRQLDGERKLFGSSQTDNNRRRSGGNKIDLAQFESTIARARKKADSATTLKAKQEAEVEVTAAEGKLKEAVVENVGSDVLPTATTQIQNSNNSVNNSFLSSNSDPTRDYELPTDTRLNSAQINAQEARTKVNKSLSTLSKEDKDIYNKAISERVPEEQSVLANIGNKIGNLGPNLVAGVNDSLTASADFFDKHINNLSDSIKERQLKSSKYGSARNKGSTLRQKAADTIKNSNNPKEVVKAYKELDRLNSSLEGRLEKLALEFSKEKAPKNSIPIEDQLPPEQFTTDPLQQAASESDLIDQQLSEEGRTPINSKQIDDIIGRGGNTETVRRLKAAMLDYSPEQIQRIKDLNPTQLNKIKNMSPKQLKEYIGSTA